MDATSKYLLKRLEGQKMRIGRSDCYTLASQGRAIFSLRAIERYDYRDYVRSSDQSKLIAAGSEKYQRVVDPFDGCIAVLSGAVPCLGIFEKCHVLCYGSDRVSRLIHVADLPIMGYYN